MHRNFFGIYHLLCCYRTILAISIHMESFNNHRSIPSWEEEVVSPRSCLPGLPVDDFLSLVLNIVDRSCLNLTFFVSESMEDRDTIHTIARSQLIVVAEAIRFNIKGKFHLSDGSFIISEGGINVVDVVIDSILIFTLFFVIHFVWEGHKCVYIRFCLPEEEYFQLNISNSILSANIDLSSDLLELSFGVSFQIIECEDKLLIVLIFPNTDFGVIVHLVVEVFDCPFVVFRFPPSQRLAVLINSIVVEISKDQSVVIQSSSFANTEVFCFREGKHLHGTGVIVRILIVYLKNLMSLKVDDVNFWLRNVTDDDFFVVDLSEEVDFVIVLSFEENFARCIAMDDALFLTRPVHSDEDESSFEGYGSTEDLGEDFRKFDGMLVLEQHILVNNYQSNKINQNKR